MHVAVDAWELALEPSSPEAWRTRELLELTGPAVDGWQWSLIRPGAGSLDLPPNVQSVEVASPGGGWGHLAFEQLALPRVAASIEADVLLTLTGGPPLSSRIPLVMEERIPIPGRTSVSDRLRRATRAAGSLGAVAFTWSDLPEGDPKVGGVTRVSPWVADRFRPVAEVDDTTTRARLSLTDGYVLALGVAEHDVSRLMSAWSWVAPSAGEVHPLVLTAIRVGGDRAAQRFGHRLGIADTIRFVDNLGYTELAAVMRGAAVLLVPGDPVDGQLLRWALACGLPVAAAATRETESILGDAGYIAPAGDARALGAACLSLLVDDDLAGSLRVAGARRAAVYHSGYGVEGLAEVLRHAAYPH